MVLYCIKNGKAKRAFCIFPSFLNGLGEGIGQDFSAAVRRFCLQARNGAARRVDISRDSFIRELL